jgi:hypothetical protein
MARVTYGALITELAGSIGGITFHKNASGNIARLKPNMPMIASPAQAVQQNKLNSLIAIWPTLTLVQKTSWNNLAVAHDHINEFGEVKTLNGFQWFMSCNLNLLQIDQAIILSAPGWSVVAAVDAFTMYVTNVQITINWGHFVNPGADYYVIYASPPIRQNSLKIRKAKFFLEYYTNHNDDIHNITASYIAAFNLVWADFYNTADANIIVRIRKIQNGTGLSSPYTSSLVKIG